MAKVIKGNFAAKQKKTPAAAYQLKVSLFYTEPLIWRRVQVPSTMTLARLHEVIQLCMGWTDSHLHQFMIDNNIYGPADLDDGLGSRKILDETRFNLCHLEVDMRHRFIYEYDFGDSWQHEIEIEKVIATDEKSPKYPVLLAGKRACPPEDIGGPPGYEHFWAAISDPENEEHEEMRDWYGSDDFDPEYFEMEEINKILRIR